MAAPNTVPSMVLAAGRPLGLNGTGDQTADTAGSASFDAVRPGTPTGTSSHCVAEILRISARTNGVSTSGRFMGVMPSFGLAAEKPDFLMAIVLAGIAERTESAKGAFCTSGPVAGSRSL